jgi:hypothetical protein
MARAAIGIAVLSAAILVLLPQPRLACASDAVAADVAVLATAGVGPEGQTEFASAWAKLAAVGPDEIPTILAGFKGATQIGENWLRSAVDAIAEHELRSNRPLKGDVLKAFIEDESNAPRARRVAYELLCKVDPATPERMLPQMLGDSSLELRRDAVQRVIDAAKGAKGQEEQKKLYRQAFEAARDIEQIKACAESLKELNDPVDVLGHMGFISKWRLIGPFDNTGRTGFAAEYPPERKTDYGESMPGKSGEVKWKEFTTTDEFGKVDLEKEVADEKEVAGYAAAVVESPTNQTAQVRIATPNGVKLFVNGRQVAAYEIYHTGTELDQYIVSVDLKKGDNTVLVKLCQNERKQSWEQKWEFQLRLTDEMGTALDVTQK